MAKSEVGTCFETKAECISEQCTVTIRGRHPPISEQATLTRLHNFRLGSMYIVCIVRMRFSNLWQHQPKAVIDR